MGVDDYVDPSLRDLVERVLPLATYYTSITSFISLRSHLEYGLVNHALCAAIRDMLKVSYALLIRWTYLNLRIGLPHSSLPARTCIHYFTLFLYTKTLVLRPSDSTHAFLDSQPRPRTRSRGRWALQLHLDVGFGRRPGGGTQE